MQKTRECVEHTLCSKTREHLKIGDGKFNFVDPKDLLVLPAGEYAVCQVQINHEQADFSHLFKWLEQNGYVIGEIFAEEKGLQLYDYLNDYRCEIKARII